MEFFGSKYRYIFKLINQESLSKGDIMILTCQRLFLVIFCIFLTSTAFTQSKDLPKDFKQILPRGRIAAITNPTFVPAAKAKISADAWILGVVIDGQARAYSLNLLNSHEVVNDQIGQTAFAAVW